MKCPTAPEMLTRKEMQILEDSVLLLKPIENVITEISGETYPTGSMTIPIIRCIKISLSRCTRDENWKEIEEKNYSQRS